jgi:hypothetical protein
MLEQVTKELIDDCEIHLTSHPTKNSKQNKNEKIELDTESVTG